MKVTSINSKTEKIYFKIRRNIFDIVRDRYYSFIESSTHYPNQIYMGPKAYHDLMIQVPKEFYPSAPSFETKGSLLGMKVSVSSHLMKDDIILLRTIR